LEELLKSKEKRTEKRLEKLEIEYSDIKIRVELLTLGLIFAWLTIFVIFLIIL